MQVFTGITPCWAPLPCPTGDLLVLLPYPLIVWGADEFVRYLLRRRHPVSPGEAPSGLGGPLSLSIAGAT